MPVISDAAANALLDGPTNANCNPSMANSVNEDYIAFFDGTGKSAARGDSGGPAIINGGTLLIGVASWRGCPRDDFPSVYTNIRHLADFIEDHIDQPGGTDTYIDENTLIDTDQVFHGDVIVQAGFELTITATVMFTETHGINVERGAKLHVDGGTLTRHCSAPDWKGIFVEGVSIAPQPSAFGGPVPGKSGIVLTTNNANIEWARNAISTSKAGEHWNASYWGGMVHCENTMFSNNVRSAEFMKYDKNNNSQFKRCTFDGFGAGVTIWDTDMIIFDNCTFNNLGLSGIRIWDAGCTVKRNCVFTNNNRGIESFATSPSFSGSALIVEPQGGGPNVFENNWVHIQSEANDLFKSIRIKENRFKAATLDGIIFDGRASSSVRKNSFQDLEYSITGANMGGHSMTFTATTWM